MLYTTRPTLHRYETPASAPRKLGDMRIRARFQASQYRPEVCKIYEVLSRFYGPIISTNRVSRHRTAAMRTPLSSIVLCLCLVATRTALAEPQVTEAFINAPLAKVWALFTTDDGYAETGAAHAEVDLRIGGEIRTHDDPNGTLGDAETTVSEILAYEPERMLAIRTKQAAASFEHRDAIAGVWTVLYFTASGEGMTHVRIVGLGYGDDPGSRALRDHFADTNRRTLDRIAKEFWPRCTLCAKETQAATP